MNIKKQILAGEGVSLDFKKTITNLEKIARTLVAFSNNKGGRLLIGVEDDGHIKGVKNEEEEKYMITQSAHFFCRPQVEPEFSEVLVDEKLVLVVDIPESDTKPHYALGEDNRWWVYVRLADKSVLASKIVVDVLRRETRGDTVFLQYSERERALLEYLAKHERINLPEFCELIKAPKRTASRILVNLVLMGVLRIVTSDKTEYYAPAIPNTNAATNQNQPYY